jgi:hypothetical protein
VSDKAVKNLTSKMGSEILVVMMTSNIDFKQDVVVEPQANRSIAIYKVTRWENCVPYFVRD